VLPIIRSHHERWDGSGYPDGLAGEEIPLLARILQVADIYDALTTARPYKPAFSHQHAMEIMIEEARRGWRDPELVPLFAEVLPQNALVAPDERSLHESLENMRRELSK
jgi:cyclic di-GMP phosphodiesterase